MLLFGALVAALILIGIIVAVVVGTAGIAFFVVFGDVWTVEQVQDVYGDKSLDEALADRRASYEHMSNIIGNSINK